MRTGPYTAVREVALTRLEQGGQTERFEVRIGEPGREGSALYRQTTEELRALYKTRPDRYFGIVNMYQGKIHLVGGGVPLATDGQLVGGVGVAGLPEGVDEKSARAGIATWMKLRETKKK